MIHVAIMATAAAVMPAGTPSVAIQRSVASAPRTFRLSASEMFKVAEQMLVDGSRGEAAAVLDFLARNPDSDIRNEARFRRSKMFDADGMTTRAALLLRQIVDERPDAAAARLELARLLERLGDADAALREVRAAQATGLPPSVARLVDRYSEALRAKRPFGASFEIALAPDSNINRATRSNSLGTVLGDFDIDEESKAKSGIGLSLRGQTYRRLALGQGATSMLFRLGGFADIYGKTNFNDIAVDLAGGPEFRLGGNQLNLEFGATQHWFGQKPFTRSLRAGATLARPIGRRMRLRLSGTAAFIDNQRNDLQDGKSYGGTVELERALSATTGLGAKLSIDREALKDPGYATTGWRAGLIGWRDVGRITMTAEANFGRLVADERLLLFLHKRSERYSRLSVGVTFRQLQWRGFAPLARFTIERNRSTIEFYDYRRTRTELGIVRAF